MNFKTTSIKEVIGFLIIVIGLGIVNISAQKIEKSSKVGVGLYEIVYNEKDNLVYVAGVGGRGANDSAKIYKLDPQTLEVKGTIDVNVAPAFGLGLNTKTQTLYTSNTRSNSVHAIDLKSGKIIATINHGKDKSHTREIVVDEETNKIYVSNMTDVWVIDGKTNKFSHLIEGTGEGSTGLALDQKSQKLYVTNMSKDQISVVDLKTNKIVSTFASGGKGPINAYFDEKGKRLFVANQGDGGITVLDPAGKLLQTVKTGAGALGVNYNPVKNLIYVANRQAGTTSVIDGKTYKILADLKTGTFPQTIAIDKKSGRVFVTNKGQGRRRPTNGETPSNEPPAEDPNGDVVNILVP